MKQSDGSEILGPNDPRNIVIGIIHVSPNDDRQSVVNAITAQDKMGRDQIVLDLPAQNKSFKTAVDFEGLHQMVGELEAAMVIVAPEKSKVANLARKESFTVYPSLEELAHAEFPPLEPDGTASSTVGPKPDAEMDSTMQFPLELPHAPSASAPAAVPVQPAVDTTPSASASPVLAPSNPMAVPPVSQPEQEEEEVTAPLVAGTGGPENPTLPLEEDEEPTDPAIAAASAGAFPVQQTAVQVSMSPASDAQAASQPASGTPASSNLPIPIIIQPNAGAVVPSNPQLPTYYEPIDMSQPRRRSWRGLLITLITILVLIALGALFYRPLLDLFSRQARQ